MTTGVEAGGSSGIGLGKLFFSMVFSNWLPVKDLASKAYN